MSDTRKSIPEVDAAPTGGDVSAPSVEADDRTGQPAPERREVLLALSPGQILGGFALLAGFIVMLRRRRRDRG